ncbi:MAG: PEPxxWA-CTERM sorting domain-containing protein [Sphingomonas bacterium]
MKTFGTIAAFAAASALAGTAHAAGPITANYYSYTSANATDTGMTFGNLLYSETVSEIDRNYSVDPAGPSGEFYPYVPFAVDFKGAFSVATSGNYTFNLGSDDGSYLFIGGTLLGAMHADQAFTRSDFTTYLTAGVHDFEVQYYNSLASEAGIELRLPQGVSYVPAVPEPATWGMMILGLGAIGATMRRRRKENVSVAYA